MARCPQCDHENAEGSALCEKCGTAIVEGMTDADKTIILSPAEVEVETKEEKIVIPIEKMKEKHPTLLVLKGPNKGDKYQVDKDEITLGRHPESDIFLDDITVSRNHAKIRTENGSFEIEDAGSLNGTYVNNKQVDTAKLEDQDEIQIGKFKLMFLMGTR